MFTCQAFTFSAMSSLQLQWYCTFFFLWTFTASCVPLTQTGSPILVVNFALVLHPHEIVCIYVFRTANTCIYSNPCFSSDEMNILLYFERNFLSCFYQFTSLTALFSCGIPLAEFVFLLTKENFIWNQQQEANWQPNVWPFCFKNTGVTNKRNFFSILNEDED